jgi:hypothetical protein
MRREARHTQAVDDRESARIEDQNGWCARAPGGGADQVAAEVRAADARRISNPLLDLDAAERAIGDPVIETRHQLRFGHRRQDLDPTNVLDRTAVSLSVEWRIRACVRDQVGQTG